MERQGVTVGWFGRGGQIALIACFLSGFVGLADEDDDPVLPEVAKPPAAAKTTPNNPAFGYLSRERLHHVALDRVEQAHSNGRLGEAATLLLSLNSKPDSWERTKDGTKWVSFRAGFHNFALKLKLADKQQFDINLEASAVQPLKQALAAEDSGKLIEVVRNFPFTKAAHGALNRLLSAYLDRGDTELTVAAARKLLQPGYREMLTTIEKLKIALCFNSAGLIERSHELMKELEEIGLSDKLETPHARDLFKRLLAAEKPLTDFSFRHSFAQQTPALRVQASLEVSDKVEDLIPDALSVSLYRDTDATFSPVAPIPRYQPYSSNRAPAPNYNSALYPRVPVFLPNQFVMRTPRGVSGFDLSTGKEIWSLPLESAYATQIEEAKKRGTVQGTYRSGAFEKVLGETNSVLNTLSSNGRWVYGIDSRSPVVDGISFPAVAGAGTAERLPIRNSLFAINTEAEAKKIEWHIGGKEDPNDPWHEHVFLGPPLPLGSHLYVLSVKAESIILSALEYYAGRKLWSQEIGLSAYPKGYFPYRSNSPFYWNGRIISVLESGIIITVDALTGEYESLFVPELKGNYATRRPTLADAAANGYLQHAISIQGEQGCYLPPESTTIFCLDLTTSNIVWQHDVQEMPLYVHAASKEHLLVVTPRSIQSLDWKSGKKLWSSDVPGVTGYGLAHFPRYFVPTSNGRIQEIDVRSGTSLGLLKQPKPGLLSGLYQSHGKFLGVSSDSVSVWNDPASFLTASSKRENQKEEDKLLLKAKAAKYDLNQPQFIQALQDLRTVAASDAAIKEAFSLAMNLVDTAYHNGDTYDSIIDIADHFYNKMSAKSELPQELVVQYSVLASSAYAKQNQWAKSLIYAWRLVDLPQVSLLYKSEQTGLLLSPSTFAHRALQHLPETEANAFVQVAINRAEKADFSSLVSTLRVLGDKFPDGKLISIIETMIEDNKVVEADLLCRHLSRSREVSTREKVTKLKESLLAKAGWVALPGPFPVIVPTTVEFDSPTKFIEKPELQKELSGYVSIENSLKLPDARFSLLSTRQTQSRYSGYAANNIFFLNRSNYEDSFSLSNLTNARPFSKPLGHNIVMSHQSGLSLFSLLNRKEVWKKSVSQQVPRALTSECILSDVAGTLTCHDPYNGSVRWERTDSNSSWNSLFSLNPDAAEILQIHPTGQLRILDDATGLVIRESKTDFGLTGPSEVRLEGQNLRIRVTQDRQQFWRRVDLKTLKALPEEGMPDLKDFSSVPNAPEYFSRYLAGNLQLIDIRTPSKRKEFPIAISDPNRRPTIWISGNRLYATVYDFRPVQPAQCQNLVSNLYTKGITTQSSKLYAFDLDTQKLLFTRSGGPDYLLVHSTGAETVLFSVLDFDGSSKPCQAIVGEVKEAGAKFRRIRVENARTGDLIAEKIFPVENHNIVVADFSVTTPNEFEIIDATQRFIVRLKP